MFGSLEKFADDKAAKPSSRTSASPATAAAAASQPAAAASGDEPPAAPAEDKKSGRPNPWHLLEEYKTKSKKYEEELSTLRTKVPSEERQKEIDRITNRAKELEEEIRYVNYTKSEEFKTKYQQPYEAAWKRATGELSELRVDDGNGGERQVVANDILEVVNLPIQEARKLAVAKFGEFADDVMGHRKEIRRLFDEQTAALDEARKTGETREKQRQEQATAQFEAASKEVQTVWNTANESAKADPKYGKYFTPVDGDQEGNQALAKGFELADRAFSENPGRAKTAEERKSIVERHAAVRNRAAAFGRLTKWNAKLESRVAELEGQLKKYTGAEPPVGGSVPSTAPASGQTRGWGGLHDALAKIAK
jgi:hypothetical protein